MKKLSEEELEKLKKAVLGVRSLSDTSDQRKLDDMVLRLIATIEAQRREIEGLKKGFSNIIEAGEWLLGKLGNEISHSEYNAALESYRYIFDRVKNSYCEAKLDKQK